MALLVTANLGRGADTAEFLRNVRAIDAEAGSGAVIGFQEIDEDDRPDEHGALRHVLGRAFSFTNWHTRVPIGYGRRWKRKRSQAISASAGLFRLSPARVISEAVLVHDRGLELVVLNVHFPRNDPRLLSRWRSVDAKLRKRIAHWHARGRTVVWLGDANRGRLGPMHPLEQTLAHDGLDWIRVIKHPAGAQVRRTDTGTVDLTIDGHDALWARVDLHTPKEHR
ncbi:endonuclease/exonuclease/phosphatase family protein [Nocardioides soli]|uniref:Endonuclease/exonuclease/phosphatase domain-containing protein n=1 Tax=Nocardioides soli TaxID=1036020 RepID=A0A7W4VSN9_9ACTN|nr:endonuclease/exonuclease/phosphatase family protein [Nocardioides soli]MBB3041036.1 hypothetical protein [Nocardioides soli]